MNGSSPESSENNQLKVASSWFNSQQLEAHEFREICQCGTEKLIEEPRNPERMRTVLILLVFFDQFIYTHYPKFHRKFKEEFHGPKLQQHLSCGYASPSWFVYSHHGYDKKANWELIADNFAGALINVRT